MKQISCDSDGIRFAVESIKKGQVIIFPTDTVYGIGCDPYDDDAIDRIFKIKKRDNTKSLPVLEYSKQIMEDIVEFDSITNLITSKFWPGQLTIVLPLKDKKLKKLSGIKNTLAVRVPSNKCTLSLLKECKLIVGTSANISGKDACTDPISIEKEISGCDVFLKDGIIHNSTASTIIAIENKNFKILRRGNISENDLAEAL